MKNIFYVLAVLPTLTIAPATAQDSSEKTVSNIYKIFQNHAKTEAYTSFQRSLMNNGALYIQSRKNTDAFMNAIGSGDFDDDTRKRLNLTTCAAFSISKLITDSKTSKNWNLPLKARLINLAPNAIEDIAIATNGASSKLDCSQIYNRYISYEKRITR